MSVSAAFSLADFTTEDEAEVGSLSAACADVLNTGGVLATGF